MDLPNIQLHHWINPISPIHTDPISIPANLVANLGLSGFAYDVVQLYVQRWASIRTHHREAGPNRLVSIYNFRVDSPLQPGGEPFRDYIRSVHFRQTLAYKINISCGFILRNKNTDRLRYFHPSVNNFRLLPSPLLVRTLEDIDNIFHQNCQTEQLQNMSLAHTPTSEWVAVGLTNIAIQIFHMRIPLIGGPSDSEEETDRDEDRSLRRDRSLTLIPREPDNLCMFRCIAQTVCGTYALQLFKKWRAYLGMDESEDGFGGVSLDHFPSIERALNVRIWLYSRETRNGGPYARLIRRPIPITAAPPSPPTDVRVHLTNDQRHVHLIGDINSYSRCHLCTKCGLPCEYESYRIRHEVTCTRTSAVKYVGGPYSPNPDVFQTLESLGINVPEALRYHKYRATFDYEAYMEHETPSHVSKPAGFRCKHVPMSVSVASNVPGFEGPTCFVSNGSPQDLVSRMYSYLTSMSKAAYDLYREMYEGVMLTISAMSAKGQPGATDPANNTLITARKDLQRWLKRLPVVGFNSGRYDLCLIKPFLIKAIMSDHQEEHGDDGRPNPRFGDAVSVIKKGNTIVTLKSEWVQFLDITFYCAPGTSYSRYLQTYDHDAAVKKSFFPYEAVRSLEDLDKEGFPPYDAFFSSLKGCNTLEEGQGHQRGLENYNDLLKVWKERGMTSLRSLLVYYNNLDTVPFLHALEKHIKTFRTFDLDLLKTAPTLPGLAVKIGMRGLDGVFYTFGEDMGDLYDLIAKNIVGGPAIVFTRFAEAGVTRIHPLRYGEQEAEVCRTIFGWDCNSLYPYSMAQSMPVGPVTVRRSPDFAPVSASNLGPRYSLVSLEWLDFIAHQTGHFIQHAANGSEVRLGPKGLPVDGYDLATMTAYQFHGCEYHGCACMEQSAPKRKRMRSFEKVRMITREELRARTEENDEYLRKRCHVTLKVMWGCEWSEMKKSDPTVKAFMKSRRSPQISSHGRPHSVLPNQTVSEQEILAAVLDGRFFGMLYVDIHVREELREMFHDFPPIFKSVEVGREDIGPFMKQYCEDHGLLKRKSKMLISSFHADHILLISPLLKWYLENGLIVSKLHLVMEWRGQQCLSQWLNRTADMRREADSDPSMKTLGETAKLTANSFYGRLAMCQDRFRKHIYCTKDKVAHYMKSNLFCDLNLVTTASFGTGNVENCIKNPDLIPEDVDFLDDEVAVDDHDGSGLEQEEEDLIYEITESYKTIRYNQPIQIPFFVYQYAKLKMIQFKYDLLDRYLSPRKWSIMYMDTDSMYVSASGSGLRDLIKPEWVEEFYRDAYRQWFPAESCDSHHEQFVTAMVDNKPWVRQQCCESRHRYDLRTPGLFKVEWEGTGMVALCAKTYFCTAGEEDGDSKSKYSCKGLQKSTNDLSYSMYKSVLESKSTSGGVNKGFRYDNPSNFMYTYFQPKRALSYLYGKRKVHDDGIHTSPLDL